MICLSWRKSRYTGDKPRGGGPARSYIIERKFYGRQRTEDGGLPAEAPAKAGLMTDDGTTNNERRTMNKKDWSEWQFAGTSYNSDVKLTKQSIGIKLWYQVRAGNASGQSMPTNTVAVVL